MTPSKAINIARKRVRIISYGNGDHVVQTWSPKYNATYESHHMDRWRVVAYAKEARIREALEQMGIEDADAEANVLCLHEGRWDNIVREFLAKRQIAQTV